MLDRSSIIGLIFGFSLIIFAIVMEGSIGVFISASSLLIVGGGVVASTMVNYSFENVKGSFITISNMMSVKSADLRTDLELMRMFARRVRLNGLLSIDDDIKHVKDSFLQTGLQLAVDGFTEESLDNILESEIQSKKRQLEISIKVLDSMSEYAPAYGMIGTVIGLIMMLQNISDPESIGVGMAIALITTLYGSILANMIFAPLAGKLDYLGKLDLNRKEMFRVGILSMTIGENPRIMEKKMLIHMEPKHRTEYLKYHEELPIRNNRDQKIYNQWIEYQNKKWETLNENLAKEAG